MSSLPESTQMFRDAAEAPERVRGLLTANAAPLAALADRLRKSPPRAVVTCARGSSDHAATFAKYLIETRLGVLTASAAPSVTSVYSARPDFDGALFLTISQSGASPDLVATAEAARTDGAFVVAIVNAEHSALAARAHLVLPLHAGTEGSVAATKTFVASLAVIVALVAAWAEDRELARAIEGAPDGLGAAWALDWSPALERLRRAESLYVIGRGLGLAIAQEAALKLKETCALHAEALSAAEVRHGPLALVRRGFPALLLAQHDETHEGVAKLAAELVARGADVLAAGVQEPAALRLSTLAAHPVIEPLLLAQSFYRMANALALARGRDPDRPPHLAKITETV